MPGGKLSHTHFGEFDKDYKAEVIAAELVECGLDPERLLIMMLGAMKRTYSRDVHAVEEELSSYDHKEYTVISTPREGIYDKLPQGLFHQAMVNKKARTTKELVKEIQVRKEEEMNARKFFLPFEATVNYLRMQMALYENHLDMRTSYSDLIDIFKEHWEIFRYMDERQSNIFLHLIPIIYDIRDDYVIAQSIYEMIFLLPVEITLKAKPVFRPTSPMFSRMGETILGVNLTTGNEIYFEGVDELHVRIGPMEIDNFASYLPGGKILFYSNVSTIS